MNADLIVGAIGGLAMLLLVNVPAARMGLTFDDDGPPGWLEPPGWLVVAVWLLLLPALGVARALVLREAATGALSWWLVALGLLCATYAYTTVGFSRWTGIAVPVLGLAVNGLVILAALALGAAAWTRSAVAGSIVVTIAAWTAFASISVVSALRRRAREHPAR